ncbi:MAG: FAD-binding protein [Acidimicrobiia bacterium]|nr:FAD-binding protein [Acidimicrobiia bacterium]
MAAGRADVLVVGGGPAGSVAALCLARAGVRVRLLEQAVFPRDKLCGDTLNPGAVALLGRLGVGEAVAGHADAIRGMRITGPGGADVCSRYGPGLEGRAIRRRDLDRILLAAAAAAGAQIDEGVVVRAASGERGTVTGVRVGVGTRETGLGARLVMAADGRQARLARQYGLARFARPRRWAFGAYYVGVAETGDCGEMHIRTDGYLGIAPLPGGLVNVCAVRELGRVGTGGDVIAEAIAGDSVLRERFRGAERVSAVATLGPLAIEASAAGVPGLLLAGDCAGFVDPMTGDGLRFAIRGAELAAEAALAELASGRPAHGWLARARRREFGGRWGMNRALRSLVGSPGALRVSSAVVARWSAPLRPLIAAAGDLALARRLGRDSGGRRPPAMYNVQP